MFVGGERNTFLQQQGIGMRKGWKVRGSAPLLIRKKKDESSMNTGLELKE